jgi:hypothetical protein
MAMIHLLPRWPSVGHQPALGQLPQLPCSCSTCSTTHTTQLDATKVITGDGIPLFSQSLMALLLRRQSASNCVATASPTHVTSVLLRPTTTTGT